MEPDKSQTLRMTYTGETLPLDRESLFWLNVLDVPPMPVKAPSGQQNYLQIAIRSRIKIFFRPTGLSGTANEAADHIKWTVVKSTAGKTYRLRASNPASFHVSFGRVALTVAGRKYEAEAGMIAPGKMADFKLKGLTLIPSGKVTIRYETLNDFGGIVPHIAALPE
jgi:chaperone protein EcpD